MSCENFNQVLMSLASMKERYYLNQLFQHFKGTDKFDINKSSIEYSSIEGYACFDAKQNVNDKPFYNLWEVKCRNYTNTHYLDNGLLLEKKKIFNIYNSIQNDPLCEKIYYVNFFDDFSGVVFDITELNELEEWTKIKMNKATYVDNKIQVEKEVTFLKYTEDDVIYFNPKIVSNEHIINKYVEKKGFELTEKQFEYLKNKML